MTEDRPSLTERFTPIRVLESDKRFPLSDEKRPLHQIAVFRKQLERFRLAHCRKFVLQSEFPIIDARSVEQLPQISAGRGKNGLQLINRRRSFADRLHLIADAAGIEPFHRVAAGAAFLVSVNSQHASDLDSFPGRCKSRRPLMKSRLLEQIRAELRASLERLSKAAFEAHAAATDPGSKAEGKYDTRSLEASYLAAGQARQVDELAAAVRIFETLSLPDFEMDDAIDAGALVEVELNGEDQFFLLVPTSGGLLIEHDGMEITLLTPDSALYRKLMGMRYGESLDQPSLRITEVS